MANIGISMSRASGFETCGKRLGQGFFVFTAALGALMVVAPCSVRGADGDEETKLIQVLQTGGSAIDKAVACARLKQIGTERSVPALAALLSEEDLSHSARYVLESMASPKAGQALVNALDRTAGLTKVGIINSLGARRETEAVLILIRLLPSSGPAQESDTAIAAAAAAALGEIGGPRAVKGLQAAARASTGSIHFIIADALLRCANRMLVSGDRAKARALLKQVYETEQLDQIRLAAFSGLLRASGRAALGLMTQAIVGGPGPAQVAALQNVPEIHDRGATKALTALLPKVAPPVQAALISGLSQRGDAAAVPAVIALENNTSPAVRLAVIQALGSLGEISAIPALARFAAAGTAGEQKAARQALVDLCRGAVTESLVARLAVASPAEQAELARALGERGDKAAIPRLQELARGEDAVVRKGALRALGRLVDEAQLDLLVTCVLRAENETARAEAAEALNSACQRLRAGRSQVNIEPLIQGLESGSTDARVALLPVCSGLPLPPVRAALRAAVQDQNAQIRAAATRALSDTSDIQLLDDLMTIARGRDDEHWQTLAVGACVRLTTGEETIKLPAKERIAPLRALLAMPLRPEQKRLVLAGLGEVGDAEALHLAAPLLEDPQVQTEAARAIIKIAEALPPAAVREGKAALEKAIAASTDAATHAAAEAALKKISAETK
jgi:HEAT repeat protein